MFPKMKILFEEAPAGGGAGGTPPATPPAAAAPPAASDPLFDKGGAPPAAAAPPAGTPPATPPGTPPPGVTIPENWKDSLPQELKDAPWMKNVTDVATLAKNMANAQKMIGADKIPIPGKSATPEEWKDVFKKLGLPESVDKYELDISKDAKVDKAFLDEFKKAAHEHGVLPQQAKALVEWFDKINQSSWETIQKENQSKVDQQLVSLKTEWGAAYDQNLVYAKAALKEFAPDEAAQNHLRSLGVGRDPVMLKFLMNAGKTLAEDKIKGAGGGSFGGLKSPAEALKEIDNIRQAASMNSKHPYVNPEHPDHLKVKKEVTALFTMAYPAQN